MRSRRYLIGAQLALVVFLVFAYNVNLRQVSSYDTYASRFVPISLLQDGDLALDEFFPELADGPDGHVNDYLFRSDGRLYDSHPPVGPLLSLPVYALPVWLGVPADPVIAANVLSKLAASLMTALAALAVFAATRRMLLAAAGVAGSTQEASGRLQLADRVALGAALAFALGTSVWSTTSQAMWSQTPAVLGYAIAMWGLAAGAWGTVGIALGAAVVARPATAPAAALLGLYVLHIAWRRAHREGYESGLARINWKLAARCCASATFVGLLGLAYNFRIFGTAGGGTRFRNEYWVQLLNNPNMFAGSVIEGLAGLTISPSRGILVFSPIVLLAFLGAYRVWKTKPAEPSTDEAQEAILLARYASLAAFAVLMVYSKYLVWWGGHGYGPRYLSDLMPLLGPLFGFGLIGLDQLARSSPPAVRLHTARSLLVLMLFVYSVAVQTIGAFCWPSPWTLDGQYYLRLWEWRDSQIITCLRSGPVVDPMARRLLERLGW